MVSAEYFDSAHKDQGKESGTFIGQIILQPNRSMTWQATQYFLFPLMSLSLTMASIFMIRGYWMILPFSVLEMGFLAGCFYFIARRTQTQEVVRFSPEEVVIEVGRKSPQTCHEWQRFFTKVVVHTPKHPWHAKRIALRCRGEEQEIGSFLTAEDKQTLINEIRQMIVAADNCQAPGRPA